MASVNGALTDPEVKKILRGVVDDLNALSTQVTALVADIAAHRTTVNAIITAATTNIAAVAAVTPAGAGTGAAATISTTKT